MGQQIKVEESIAVVVRDRRDNRTIDDIDSPFGGDFLESQLTPFSTIDEPVQVEFVGRVGVAEIEIEVAVVFEIKQDRVDTPSIAARQSVGFGHIDEAHGLLLEEKRVFPDTARGKHIRTSIEIDIADGHGPARHARVVISP
jgi:hypothetical protein